MPDPKSHDRPESEIADASLLFGGAEKPSAPKVEREVEPSEAEESYGVVGGAEAVDETAVKSPVPAPAPSVRPRTRSSEETRSDAAPSSESRVDEVWTRGAEWGATLAVLGAALGAGLFLTWAAFNAIGFGFAFVLFMLMSVALLVLAYPIFITLERPVRVAPEQAARDYFEALSHRRPHYRRMWLLLSNTGKKSARFDSFPAFQAFWKSRLAELRTADVRGPIRFEVAGFKSEKSGGKSHIDGKFTVKVSAGGKTEPLELGEFPIESGFVKGPDNMWYLDRGVL